MTVEEKTPEPDEALVEIEVECPKCGQTFTATCRKTCPASPSAICPHCGQRVGLPPLVQKL